MDYASHYRFQYNITLLIIAGVKLFNIEYWNFHNIYTLEISSEL
jgi:hypothetical protein